MKWTAQQDAALMGIEQWFKNDTENQQVYRLFGYAGTGKTTIAEYLQELGRVGYAALSGKAASVLASKGCSNAQTIHSLIYKHIEDPETGKISYMLRSRDKMPKYPSELYNMDLLVVDEVSMVGDEVGNDLLSFGVPILVIGDPFQLPPVEGGGFFINEKPDVTLHEIHRQAKDNPIITMASKVRLDKTLLDIGSYGDSRVVRDSANTYDLMFNSDQVLCGTNVKRQRFNQRIRKKLGAEGEYPQPNDKIICLKNYRDRGLMNGTLWYVNQSIVHGDGETIDMTLRPENCLEANEAGTLKADETGRLYFPVSIQSTLEMFQYKDKEKLYEIKSGRSSRGYDQFDFGYAITVHKAQGSQWDDVVIYDDSWDDRNEPDFRYRWLYTAITRAAKTVTVIGRR